MRLNKLVAQMTPEEKAALKARMLAEGMDDSDVFPGVLGNKITAFPTKPFRRRKSAARKLAKSNRMNAVSSCAAGAILPVVINGEKPWLRIS